MRAAESAPTLCPTVTRVSGRGNAIDYGAHSVQAALPENMNDHKKKVPEDNAETRELEQLPDVGSEDDTRRLPTLTIQELERLLKQNKPGP